MKRLPSADPNIALFEGSTGNRITIYVDGSHAPSIGGWPEGSREWTALAWVDLRMALAIVEEKKRHQRASERNRQNAQKNATNAEVLSGWRRYVESNEAAGRRATVNEWAERRPYGLSKSALYAKIPKSER